MFHSEGRDLQVKRSVNRGSEAQEGQRGPTRASQRSRLRTAATGCRQPAWLVEYLQCSLPKMAEQRAFTSAIQLPVCRFCLYE